MIGTLSGPQRPGHDKQQNKTQESKSTPMINMTMYYNVHGRNSLTVASRKSDFSQF